MASEFVKYLQPDSILIIEGDTKKKILDEIVAHACTRCTMDEDQLREAIWKRERMMTTGVGKGLALPHIRVNGFPSPLVIVAICQKAATDYNSMDNQPIRLAVFLAADERDQEAYLKLLGSISAKLKEDNVIDRIFECGNDTDKIMGILSE
ncbi:MAG: PTS sugar transporter subunit IIA [Lentisphaeria bacterium]|nr:PTS sugar transporter subunit IIA [Lentisphaeria bacterium]MBR4075819.1 PTS sugar transporter subunit IIA [Lentisphaeria bacterium]